MQKLPLTVPLSPVVTAPFRREIHLHRVAIDAGTPDAIVQVRLGAGDSTMFDVLKLNSDGQAAAEYCYPIILQGGHVAKVVGAGTDAEIDWYGYDIEAHS